MMDPTWAGSLEAFGLVENRRVDQSLHIGCLTLCTLPLPEFPYSANLSALVLLNANQVVSLAGVSVVAPLPIQGP